MTSFTACHPLNSAASVTTSTTRRDGISGSVMVLEAILREISVQPWRSTPNVALSANVFASLSGISPSFQARKPQSMHVPVRDRLRAAHQKRQGPWGDRQSALPCPKLPAIPAPRHRLGGIGLSFTSGVISAHAKAAPSNQSLKKFRLFQRLSHGIDQFHRLSVSIDTSFGWVRPSIARGLNRLANRWVDLAGVVVPSGIRRMQPSDAQIGVQGSGAAALSRGVEPCRFSTQAGFGTSAEGVGPSASISNYRVGVVDDFDMSYLLSLGGMDKPLRAVPIPT